MLFLLPFLFSKPSYLPHVKEHEFDEQEDININQINAEKTFTNETTYTGTRNTRAFFRCLIFAINANFLDCYSLGPGYTYGSGGCVYLSTSNFYSENSVFKNSAANFGGAVASIGGDIIMTDSTFSNNIAYK